MLRARHGSACYVALRGSRIGLGRRGLPVPAASFLPSFAGPARHGSTCVIAYLSHAPLGFPCTIPTGEQVQVRDHQRAAQGGRHLLLQVRPHGKRCRCSRRCASALFSLQALIIPGSFLNQCGPARPAFSQVDLCHGPHVPNTGLLKAVGVNSMSRAFWRADVNREPLQVCAIGRCWVGCAPCCALLSPAAADGLLGAV